MGRPTDYTPELIEEAWKYVNDDSDAVPSVAGLCCAINISRTTAYDWAKEEDKEFSDILEAILRKQEKTLIENGLKGSFNSTITKLMLTKHGYSDKQDLNAKVDGAFKIEVTPDEDALN